MLNTTAAMVSGGGGDKGGVLPLSSLNHISIVCTSVKESLDFYMNVLGFTPIRRPGSFDFDGAWLFNYGVGVHLLQSEHRESLPAKKEINPKDNHISFQVGIRTSLPVENRYSIGMRRTCVYIHHVDKDAFLKGNIDPDPDELDIVFNLCPSYGELLEQVRKDLNWMDPSDVVEFDGRHNVGFGIHFRWKTMRVNFEQRWLAYKDTLAESLDKALELFAIKINVPNLLDLNRVASSIVEAIPAPINEKANIEPLSCVDEANEEVNIEHEPLVEANDEHDDDENDGNVLHDNNLGDLNKYNLQETMDHSIRQWTILFRIHVAMPLSLTMGVLMKKLMRKGSRQRRLKLSRRY
ncbi:hypothetical protein D1007_13273 [Hordeum vulgare]|nr:hypothetical protein D1007_13273 [Hordeum vulgare]